MRKNLGNDFEELLTAVGATSTKDLDKKKIYIPEKHAEA